MSSMKAIPGIGPATSDALAAMGIDSPEKLAQADPASLTQVRGITPARAQRLTDAARAIARGQTADTTPDTPAPVQADTTFQSPADSRARAATKGAKTKSDTKKMSGNEKDKAKKAKAKAKEKAKKIVAKAKAKAKAEKAKAKEKAKKIEAKAKEKAKAKKKAGSKPKKKSGKKSK